MGWLGSSLHWNLFFLKFKHTRSESDLTLARYHSRVYAVVKMGAGGGESYLFFPPPPIVAVQSWWKGLFWVMRGSSLPITPIKVEGEYFVARCNQFVNHYAGKIVYVHLDNWTPGGGCLLARLCSGIRLAIFLWDTFQLVQPKDVWTGSLAEWGSLSAYLTLSLLGSWNLPALAFWICWIRPIISFSLETGVILAVWVEW